MILDYYIHDGDKILQWGNYPDYAKDSYPVPEGCTIVWETPTSEQMISTPERRWSVKENRVIETPPTPEGKWDQIRFERDRLLAESDWIVNAAYEAQLPVPEEWSQYRQALRNITEQPDPFNISWPEKPSIRSAPAAR